MCILFKQFQLTRLERLIDQNLLDSENFISFQAPRHKNGPEHALTYDLLALIVRLHHYPDSLTLWNGTFISSRLPCFSIISSVLFFVLSTLCIMFLSSLFYHILITFGWVLTYALMTPCLGNSSSLSSSSGP